MDKLKTSALVMSALVMFATVLAHVFLGGPEINATVQSSALPPEVRSTSAVVWHMITALLIYLCVSTVVLIRRNNVALAIGLIALEAVFAGLFFGIGLNDFSSVLVLPQWTAFALCAALTIPALGRSPV